MRALVLALGLLATPALAVEANTPRVASAGDPIWSSDPAPTVQNELVLVDAARGGGFFSTAGTVEVLPGTILDYIETKTGPRACSRDTNYVMVWHTRACLIDSDQDGQFDQFSYNENGKIAALKKPAKYTKRPRLVSDNPSFESRIIYLGTTGSTLNLSYREFKNDLARSAFTEELTIPLTSAYPQRVRFKGLEMVIFGIDGLGLRYSISPVSPAP
ncbi:hypothetical protein [Sphingomonas endolithica]|uniref:hypothetical protein n=1 Tax=Sphingomonas endolithica TaxID=2972485 RepID=UPI0021AE8EE2|nr:hypothetical protein [Sphingomonas sp. ZFBP2030]